MDSQVRVIKVSHPRQGGVVCCKVLMKLLSSKCRTPSARGRLNGNDIYCSKLVFHLEMDMRIIELFNTKRYGETV